VTYMSSANHTF